MQQMNSCVDEMKKWKANKQLFFCWRRLGNRWNSNCTLLDFIILVNTVRIVPLIEEYLCNFKLIQFYWLSHPSCKCICSFLVVLYSIWWPFSAENNYIERTLHNLIFFPTSSFTLLSGIIAEMCLSHYSFEWCNMKWISFYIENSGF